MCIVNLSITEDTHEKHKYWPKNQICLPLNDVLLKKLKGEMKNKDNGYENTCFGGPTV